MDKLRHVVCDLDGTLLNSNQKVAEADTEILHALGKLGVCRTIATGRSLYSFRQVVPEDFPIDYLIICAGGAVIDFRTKEILRTSVIPKEAVQRTAARLRELQIDYQVREPVPEDHYYRYERFFKHNPDFDRLNDNYAEYVSPIHKISDLGSASRIISIAPGPDYIPFFENLSSQYSIIRATSPTDYQSVWMEMYPKGVNKGNALEFLNQKLGIEISRTIGLGNDYNDLHFLDITARSFVTSNAPENLKMRYESTVDNNSAPLSAVIEKLGVF